MFSKWLLIIISGLLLSTSEVSALPKCEKVFTNRVLTRLSLIRFTQDFLGHFWAQIKLRELELKYEQWLKKNPQGGPEQFVENYVQHNKPIPAVRDFKGVVRIIDRHHTFYAIVLFLGTSRAPAIHIDIVKDYSFMNFTTGQAWTARSMMRDLIDNGFVNFENTGRPTYKQLKELPSQIFQLRDNPSRTVLSMVFRRMPNGFKLKGSDFTPQTQNQLIKELQASGFELFPEGVSPYSIRNLDRIKRELLGAKDLLEFLRDNINPDLQESRMHKVADFLHHQIEALN